MSCEGCITTKRGEDEALSSIKVKAKQYAEENKIPIAIYKEGTDYAFINAETAISGGYPIIQVVSQYN